MNICRDNLPRSVLHYLDHPGCLLKGAPKAKTDKLFTEEQGSGQGKREKKWGVVKWATSASNWLLDQILRATVRISTLEIKGRLFISIHWSCAPIRHRWPHILTRATLMDGPCGSARQVPGGSTVSENPQNRKQETQCNLEVRRDQQEVSQSLGRTVCGSRRWNQKSGGEEGRCHWKHPIQQTQLVQRIAASQAAKGSLKATPNERWRR